MIDGSVDADIRGRVEILGKQSGDQSGSCGRLLSGLRRSEVSRFKRGSGWETERTLRMAEHPALIAPSKGVRSSAAVGKLYKLVKSEGLFTLNMK